MRTHLTPLTLRSCVLAICALLSCALIAACTAPAASAPNPTPTHVAPVLMTQARPLFESDALTVHLFQTTVSNGYLLETSEGVTMVDAGLPTSRRLILNRLEEIGRPGELCELFLTHAHIDHVGAAAALQAELGAEVLIHEDDAANLAAGRTQLGAIRNWAWTRDALPTVEQIVAISAVTPDRTVVDGEQLDGCGLEAEVMHLPGHTAGSAALIVTDPATGTRFAFVGDLISTTGGGHIQSSYALDWGDVAESFERVVALGPDWVFPGHGTIQLRGSELATMEITGPAAQHSR